MKLPRAEGFQDFLIKPAFYRGVSGARDTSVIPIDQFQLLRNTRIERGEIISRPGQSELAGGMGAIAGIFDSAAESSGDEDPSEKIWAFGNEQVGKIYTVTFTGFISPISPLRSVDNLYVDGTFTVAIDYDRTPTLISGTMDVWYENPRAEHDRTTYTAGVEWNPETYYGSQMYIGFTTPGYYSFHATGPGSGAIVLDFFGPSVFGVDGALSTYGYALEPGEGAPTEWTSTETVLGTRAVVGTYFGAYV